MKMPFQNKSWPTSKWDKMRGKDSYPGRILTLSSGFVHPWERHTQERSERMMSKPLLLLVVVVAMIYGAGWLLQQ